MKVDIANPVAVQKVVEAQVKYCQGRKGKTRFQLLEVRLVDSIQAHSIGSIGSPCTITHYRYNRLRVDSIVICSYVGADKTTSTTTFKTTQHFFINSPVFLFIDVYIIFLFFLLNRPIGGVYSRTNFRILTKCQPNRQSTFHLFCKPQTCL